MHEFYRCVTFCVDVVVVAVASGGKTDGDDCDFYCCCFSYFFFFLLSRWWRRRRRKRKRDGCKSFDKNYFCSVSWCSHTSHWLCSSSSSKKRDRCVSLFFCVVFLPVRLLVFKSHPEKINSSNLDHKQTKEEESTTQKWIIIGSAQTKR